MSVVGGNSEEICSVRVFPSLTQRRHQPQSEKPAMIRGTSDIKLCGR
jgi:hypothetical protein